MHSSPSGRTTSSAWSGRWSGFDTVSVDLSPGSDHRRNEEAQLQEFVGTRLGGLGAEVDQFEPDAAALRRPPDDAALASLGGPADHRGHPARRRQRPVVDHQRPHRRGEPRRSRALDEPALPGRPARRADLRTRRRGHEGRDRLRDLRPRSPVGQRDTARRRRDRRGGSGRGDLRDGHGRRDRARVPRRRRPGARAHEAEPLDRDARTPARCGGRARALRPRRDEPTPLARRGWRERDRAVRSRTAGPQRPERRVGGPRLEGAPSPGTARRPADHHPGRSVHLQRPGELQDRPQRDLPAG